MAYGLNTRLFVENGPANQAAEALSHSSSNAFRAWQSADRERRFALVQSALKTPANDVGDGFPIAL
ncbi:hypothetical protein [Sphingomonas sp.]|uniref:hypothetical protein n=1 Tax=Sphingomonas sp. TaxID=28214 RepID=UPI00286E2D84|nr:hypothetical protein [Sphingomonas sp.]